jgi:outer membrane receptor protein involved in Fe transport
MKKIQSGRGKMPALTQVAALIATSTFVLVAAPVLAQSASTAENAEKGDTSGLNRVVVTATSSQKSKMRSSVSVTDVDQEAIKDFGARTEAEVLLLIPGIRTEATAGPGGNANITVRGLPIASGGSKYVQLQEDGLPTVQFGDMNFSNNDYWIRFDNNVDSIQTLRGGSASTFASHAPGAVINYISKTGKEKGGNIGLSRGLNYNETRVDADYGDRLAPDLRYHIGGYYREGEGARNYTKDALLGYQLKGNVTKEFNGGKGYFRVNFKALDEHAPTTPQTFIKASQSGNTIGGFSRAPGFDGTRDSQYSIYNSSFTSINPATRAVETTSLTDGITVNSKSLGFEFHNELKDGFSVDNKFRMSKNAGAFQTQFWDVQTLSNLLAGFGNGSKAKYANGPLAGTAVTASNLSAGFVSKGAAINTQTPDMGNLVNDLSVAKQFKINDGMALDTRAGFFHSRQNVVQRWAISERVVEAGKNGAVIDVTDSAGAALTTMGLTGYNNQWGACCARDIDAHFTTDAPYLALALSAGALDVDAGVRRESFRADGRYAGSKQIKNAGKDELGNAVTGLDVNQDGLITGAEKNAYVADVANPGLVNYKVSYTNFSLGANYRLNSDLSAFARTSKGHRAIADRLLYSSNIDSVTGQLTAGGKSAAVAPVKQSEVGMRYRGKQAWGSYNVAATLFRSTTTEFDYDQTRQDDPQKPNYQGPKLNVVGYKSNGLELEGGVSSGIFGITYSIVHSTETKTSDLVNPGDAGKTSGGVPKIRYNLSPRVAIGDAVVGATVRGQGWVYADGSNTTKIDGHYIVNAFANYNFSNGLTLALNVSNLFDKVYPASGGGFVSGGNGAFGAGVETGRTANVSVRYAF